MRCISSGRFPLERTDRKLDIIGQVLFPIIVRDEDYSEII